MPQTPDSSSTSYATPDDLVVFRDYRSIAQFIKDDDTEATLSEVLSSPVVSSALLAASGDIESACAVGGKYRPEDLLALTGAARQLLKELCCTIAFWKIASRRLVTVRKEDITGVVDAYAMLEQLQLGKRVFSTKETQDAGVGETVDWTKRPESCKMVTNIAWRFFPRYWRY